MVVLATTALAVWGTRQLVADQQRRLLAGRTREVGAVLSTAFAGLAPSLTTLDAVLAATRGNGAAFARVAAQEVLANPGTSFAWLRPTVGGWRVAAVAGPGLADGQVLAGERAVAASDALADGGLWPTPVLGSGSARAVGFAYGAATGPRDGVIYREAPLGPARATRQGAADPFRELEVVLYAGPVPDPSQVVVSTAAHLPLAGEVASQPVAVGHTPWLLEARATGPLVGSVAADAQWGVLALGLLLAAAATLSVEVEARRREAALALYAGERTMAVALQRSLLPEVPQLDGLDVAARYQAGGAGQQVGGDWFDVFPLAGGRVAVVIGDVMGHDLAAAASMAQVRATLRAFAWEGRSPAAVLGDLDEVVGAFSLAPLVTTFLGVLEPPGPDGARALHYSNAGHLPPLLRHPGGRVEVLSAGAGVLIGALPGRPRPEATTVVPPGALLVCATDGLVEAPGEPIEAGLARIEAVVASTVGAEATCAALLATAGAALRDDVAVLAVGVVAAPEAPDVRQAGQTSTPPGSTSTVTAVPGGGAPPSPSTSSSSPPASSSSTS